VGRERSLRLSTSLTRLQRSESNRNGKVLSKAVVIGADGARDIALVRTEKPISGYRFQISAKTPRLGDSVVAIGYPFGLPLSVTKGR